MDNDLIMCGSTTIDKSFIKIKWKQNFEATCAALKLKIVYVKCEERLVNVI